MERNEQYQQFEGLAVSLGAKCFAKWRDSLSRRGVELGDAVAEAQLALIELAPRLEDPRYVQQQRIAFVSKSIRGRLRNWAEKQSRNGDHRERPPEPAGVDPDELLDLDAAMAQIDETTEDIVRTHIAGESFRSIAERHGISESAARRIVTKGMARLRKLMHAGDS